MRASWVVVLLLLAAASVCEAQPPAAPPDPGGEVHQLERSLADAMNTRDRPQLESLLSSDFVLRSSPDISRDTWIRNAVTLCWGDHSDIDNFHARRLEDVVIAAFELTFYVDPATCHHAVLRSLITDVWTRTPDGWQLQVRHAAPPPRSDAGVASQYGIIPEPPPTWDISSELSLVATAGNTSTRTLGAASTVLHRAGDATTRGQINFLTSENGPVTAARSLTSQIRHGVRVSARLEVFGDGAYTRDRFAGILNRSTAEGGLGYSTPSSRPQALTAEVRVGYTDEQRLDGTQLRFAEATGALRYDWRLRPGTQLTQDTGVVQDLTSATNWRATSTTAVTVTLTQLLSLKASHAIEYRHVPVVGFLRMDMRTSAALVLSFQHRPPAP